MTTVAPINQQYDPSLTIANSKQLIEQLSLASASVLASHDVVENVSYAENGDTPNEYMDFYPPATGNKVPVHVFIHGGFFFVVNHST